MSTLQTSVELEAPSAGSLPVAALLAIMGNAFGGAGPVLDTALQEAGA
jgi:hypothetical protein